MEDKDFIAAYGRYVNAETGDECSEWARDYTDWAKAVGLFVSDGNGNYRWGAPITREELCAVLYRFYRALENVKSATEV